MSELAGDAAALSARLPVHWMWWSAIGGLLIGLGGLAESRARGAGYDVIDQLLTGRAGLSLIVGRSSPMPGTRCLRFWSRR